MPGDRMTIKDPATGEKRYLVDDKNEITDLRKPHEHLMDEVRRCCSICGMTEVAIRSHEGKEEK